MSTPSPFGSAPSLADELHARQRAHVLYTWTAQRDAQPVPIKYGEGALFYDHDDQRWFDFESQVFNCNVGHGNRRVIEAIKAQAEQLACAHPAALFESKARLGELLAEVTPGDMSHAFLCLSGSEAVENAYKVARLVTGRAKVIARRRSYHGASMGALSLTGDARRLPLEPGLWGVLRADDPYCYRCPYGLERGSCARQCVGHIEHVIEMEGAHTIAAIFAEGVTGSNGGFIPPDDYWPRLRALCDKHGILLVADEVFSGFGRTGEWFAVDNWGVVPDLMTCAKGLTSGYAPMGALIMKPELAAHFDHETLWSGLTSYAHPISCAAAVASIEAYREEGLIDNAKQLGQHLRAELEGLSSEPWYGEGRALGLFGTLELKREALSELKGGEPAFAQALKRALKARRVHALYKDHNLFITPPLCITKTQLDEGLGLTLEATRAALHELS